MKLKNLRSRLKCIDSLLLQFAELRESGICIYAIVDYSWSLRGVEDTALEKVRSECHERGAQRLLGLCFANGGIYIKLGQHLGMLDHLLPLEYVETMRNNLLDRCPVSSLKEVHRTIEEDFNAPVSEVFSDFSDQPIASASLAQVHIARDATTGERVAVKVQHRGLRDTSDADLFVIDALVRAVKWMKPNVDFRWLVNEAKYNLPRELDFLIEAANAQRCSAMLVKQSPKGTEGLVHVPEVILNKTSHRVLTMEYIEGVKVTDHEGLDMLRIPKKKLASIISKIFNAMIFQWGWVHADPHGANMLVRRTLDENKKSKWQLVLLDHGLYRELDNSFRLQYASLWRSLVFGDEEGIRKSAKAMNAGEAVPLFAGMLTQRPWAEITASKRGTTRLRLKYTQKEKDELQEYAGQYANEVAQLLAKIPRELLLLLKTNDCLRSVDAELGAGVNTFVETARACENALMEKHRIERIGPFSLVSEKIKVEWRLTLLRTVSWGASFMWS